MQNTRMARITFQNGAPVMTYGNDDEIEPTPRVGEVLLKSVRAHFNDHFADENHCERFVHILQNHLEYFPLRQIDVFNCLSTTKKRHCRHKQQITPGDLAATNLTRWHRLAEKINISFAAVFQTTFQTTTVDKNKYKKNALTMQNIG